MTATFVVEDGTGLSNSNSFVSVAEATQYNEDHYADAVWTAATQAAQEQALRMATQYLTAKYNGMWRGYLTSATQALPWPRYHIYQDWYRRPGNTVPKEVKDATCELAIRYANNTVLTPDLIAGEGTETFDRVVIGPLEFEKRFNTSVGSVYPIFTIVQRILYPFLIGGSEVARG